MFQLCALPASQLICVCVCVLPVSQLICACTFRYRHTTSHINCLCLCWSLSFSVCLSTLSLSLSLSHTLIIVIQQLAKGHCLRAEFRVNNNFVLIAYQAQSSVLILHPQSSYYNPSPRITTPVLIFTPPVFIWTTPVVLICKKSGPYNTQTPSSWHNYLSPHNVTTTALRIEQPQSSEQSNSVLITK